MDDGLATATTMRAAVRSVQAQGPGRLVVAVPVGSRQACAALRGEVDEVVACTEPALFLAVGLHYAQFEPTEDAEVRRLLNAARPPATSAPSTPPPAAHLAGGNSGPDHVPAVSGGCRPGPAPGRARPRSPSPISRSKRMCAHSRR